MDNTLQQIEKLKKSIEEYEIASLVFTKANYLSFYKHTINHKALAFYSLGKLVEPASTDKGI